MSRFLPTALAVVLSVAGQQGQAGTPVSVTADGWTVTADAETGLLSIMHDNLGTVMEKVQLNLQGVHALRALKGWTATKTGSKQLLLRTSDPPTSWRIDWDKDWLKISSTS